MPMRIGTEMPKLAGATEWFGATQAHAEAEAQGRPVLVHFWSVSCGICKENMSRISEWRDARQIVFADAATDRPKMHERRLPLRLMRRVRARRIQPLGRALKRRHLSSDSHRHNITSVTGDRKEAVSC